MSTLTAVFYFTARRKKILLLTLLTFAALC